MLESNFVMPIFKTINETAEMTGLAKYHLRKLVLTGRIKYIKTGKKYLLQLDSLFEYLKTGDNRRNGGN